MKNKKIWLGSLILAVATVNCAKESTSADGAASSLIAAQSREHAQALITETAVSCGNLSSKECLPGIALVASANDTHVSTCTGVLVAKDTLATSLNCLPKEIRKPRDKCSTLVRAAFPATQGHPAAQSRCIQVVSVSPNQNLAVLKMESIGNRPSANLSGLGLPNSLTLQLLRAEPASKDRPEALIQRVACRTIQRSAVFPSFKDSKNELGLISDCNFSEGDAGAPLIDSDQQVRALVHSRLNDGEVQKLYQAMQVSETAPQFSVVSNSTCLQARCKAGSGIAGTNNNSNGSTSEMMALLSSELIDRSKKFENDLRASRSGSRAAHALFGWEVTALQKDDGRMQVRAIPLPKCLDHPESWVGTHRGFFRFPTRSRVEERTPVWTAQFTMNRYLQPITEVLQDQSRYLVIEFNPRQISNDGKSRVTVKFESGASSSAVQLMDRELSTCSP